MLKIIITKNKNDDMKLKRLICRIFGHKWKRPMKSTEGQEWYVCDRCLKQEYRRY